HTLANLRANRQVCLASVGSIAMALSFLGLFLFIYTNLADAVSTWSRQVELIIFLEDEITAPQRSRVESLLKAGADVRSAEFTSREEAWKQFREQFSGSSEIIGDLDFNPLPASYTVQFHEGGNRVEKIQNLAQTVQTLAGVESAEFGKPWVARFETFLILLRVFLWVLGGALAMGVLLIVSNTIRLSVYSRQKEIELMLLIGATPRYIKLPFFLEGMVQSFLGALLAVGLIKALHFYLIFQLSRSLESFALGPHLQFLSPEYICLLILASVLMGLMGSAFSINQYLRSYTQ
ncbi:MAG: cell division protein FtsX, partial [Nitrospinaceae bacterium]